MRAVCQLDCFPLVLALLLLPSDAARPHVARMRAVSRQPVAVHSRAAALPLRDGVVAQERVDPQLVAAAPRPAVVLLPCGPSGLISRARRRLGVPVARQQPDVGAAPAGLGPLGAVAAAAALEQRLPVVAAPPDEVADWRVAEWVEARLLARRPPPFFRCLDLELRKCRSFPVIQRPPVHTTFSMGASAWTDFVQRNAGQAYRFPRFGGYDPLITRGFPGRDLANGIIKLGLNLRPLRRSTLVSRHPAYPLPTR